MAGKSVKRKTLNNTKQETDDIVYKCVFCGKEGKRQLFFNNRNDFMQDNLSLCRVCVTDLLKKDDRNNNSMDNMLKIFRILDYPFFLDVWEDCSGKNTSEKMSTYLKKINTPTSKFSKFNYKDGQDINVIGGDIFDQDSNLARWGDGFNEIECKKMNQIVDDYIKLTGKEDFKSIKDFERVARISIAVDRVHANKESKANEIKQAEETLTAVMKEAGLTSDKMSSANKASSLGEWIDIFESHDPISEPSDEFKDVDGIGRYIERFFYKNLMRVFGKDTSRISDEFEDITKELKEKEKKFGG